MLVSGGGQEDFEGLDKVEDSPKKQWVAKMVKSARRYHKLCPYFDKKTGQCLLYPTIMGDLGKCDREGRYENCPIFLKFLENAYDTYTKKRKVLPRDFQDLVNQVFLLM